jgi:uncharacterized protein (DUF1778 family)
MAKRDSFEFSYEEIEDALECVKADAKRDIAVRHPLELDLIENNRTTDLAAIKASIDNGDFIPADAPIVDAPKGRGLLRPAHQLAIRDQIVYAAMGRAILPYIEKDLPANHTVIDFAERILKRPLAGQWFERYFVPHQEFTRSSIHEAQKHDFVVVADISAFYENISHAFLISELRRIGVPNDIITLLRNCLRTWSNDTDRGIPQGFLTSDLLAKLYMVGIDERIIASGRTHKRYKDDIRIFCANEVDAKVALKELNSLLRERTLNVQSAKTGILKAVDAIKDFEGFMPEVRAIANRLESERERERIFSEIFSSPYVSVREAIEAQRDEGGFPIFVLEEAFATQISGNFGASFNKSLFRFLLTNLGKAKNRIALSDALERFKDYPQETTAVLVYAGRVMLDDDDYTKIFEFLDSPDSIYDFQVYEILEFLQQHPPSDKARLLALARRYADHTQPHFVRTVARMILGDHGTAADIERMHAEYREAQTDRERAEIVWAIRRLERSRRNTLYARAEKNGGLVEQAVKKAKKEQP